MGTKRKIAFGLHLFCVAVIFAMSMVYLFTPKFMPYHQQAVGVSWEELPPRFQTAVMASIRTVAGGFLAAALSLFLLTWFPFRKGEPWAAWGLLGVALSVGLPALFSLVLLARNTPAAAPVLPMGIWLSVAILAFILGTLDKDH